MNKITIELSDEALADLHAVQLTLRAMWKNAPGLENYEVTEADAIRTALSLCVAGDWTIADLVPDSKGAKQ